MLVDVTRVTRAPRWALLILGLAAIAAVATLFVSLGVGAADLANLGSAAAVTKPPAFEIDGIAEAITSVTLPANLQAAIALDPITHRPSRVTLDPLTVTRKFSQANDWYQWYKFMLDGRLERKSISMIYPDHRVSFFLCWPRQWKGPALNASSSSSPSEELVLQCETAEMR